MNEINEISEINDVVEVDDARTNAASNGDSTVTESKADDLSLDELMALIKAKSADAAMLETFQKELGEISLSKKKIEIKELESRIAELRKSVGLDDLEAKLESLREGIDFDSGQAAQKKIFKPITNPDNSRQVYKTGAYLDWLIKWAEREGITVYTKNGDATTEMKMWVKRKRELEQDGLQND